MLFKALESLLMPQFTHKGGDLALFRLFRVVSGSVQLVLDSGSFRLLQTATSQNALTGKVTKKGTLCSMLLHSETDLGLLQHPRWSAL